MRKTDNGQFPFYTFDCLAKEKGLLHFVSSGLKDIGFPDAGPIDEIIANRELLAGAVGFEAGQLTMGGQVHSTNIKIVSRDEAGRGAWDKPSRFPETDALVTDNAGVCLTVLSADCVPVLLYEPERRVIAAIHAGWRGTAGNIAGKTAKLMQEKFGCCPERMLAGIGPSIGKCCFEVGEEVAEVFREKFPADEKNILFPGKNPGKYQVDLWEINRRELLCAGLLPENIEVAGYCTVCGHERFFSYRREGKAAGRFGAGIILV